jgi:hypothetical protein
MAERQRSAPRPSIYEARASLADPRAAVPQELAERTTSSPSTSARTTRPRTACCGSSSTSTARTSSGSSAVIGYLHTGFEKNMEQKTWWKAITYPERIDYVSFQYNELVFVLAIEKLLGIEVRRARRGCGCCSAS